MTLSAALRSFDRALAGIRTGVRDGALLAPAAGDCLEMARAYRADAGAFARSGDGVNALAAAAYAAGWLDAAVAIGLLDGEGPNLPPLRGVVAEHDAARLDEKARRYAAMLDGAIGSAVPAPDRSSPAAAAALGLLAVAKALLGPAWALLAAGDPEGSLSVSSYAYGWLDAGVRSGLVAITGDRSLFAV